MKFGRTLQDRISEGWAPHSVNYKGMKRALGDYASVQDLKVSAELKSEGGVSGETQCARVYSVDRDKFFHIYEESKDRIRRFYLEREAWAKGRVWDIRQQVDALRESPPSSWSPSAPDSLEELVAGLQHEIDTLTEFLKLNLTGFSKILKKYDKRTGSSIREEEMLELRKTHPYLEGGGLAELKEELALIEAELDQLKRVKETRTSDVGRKRPRKSREEIQFEKCQAYIKKIVESSPLFTKNGDQRTPHFQHEEIYARKLLGYGEFNNVYEIEEVRVPESCHICFLHKFGGDDYQQPGESSGSTDPHRPGSKVENEEMQHSDSQQASIEGTKIIEDQKEAKEGIKEDQVSAGLPTPIRSGSFVAMSSYMDEVSDYDEIDSDHEDEEHKTRGFMKDHCFRDGKARYAIKMLRNDLSLEAKEDAAIDLAMEAKFLEVLVHPNIINIRGTVGLSGTLKFCIVLDRLVGTLADEMSEWSRSEKKCRGFMGMKKKKNKGRLRGLWMDRMLALYDVSRAMRYLHSRNVVFRDLKPDNIGFDIRGNAKVFDFGLAEELQARKRLGDDEYKLSGLTGTRRYMAPEVAMCKPYGLSADIYSFGITAWETATLRSPFEDYSLEKHSDLVVIKGQRPKIPSSWPAMFKDLVKECWSSSPSGRPLFSRICPLLKGYLADHERGLELTDRSILLMDASIISRRGAK